MKWWFKDADIKIGQGGRCPFHHHIRCAWSVKLLANNNAWKWLSVFLSQSHVKLNQYGSPEIFPSARRAPIDLCGWSLLTSNPRNEYWENEDYRDWKLQTQTRQHTIQRERLFLIDVFIFKVLHSFNPLGFLLRVETQQLVRHACKTQRLTDKRMLSAIMKEKKGLGDTLRA